ncbi:hypothetical protein [Thermomonas sp.]|uniref:hypothetical protein n=1 Tax=Thermomonas sp. TaxID=1971895 RepID=UPI0025E0F196|nr:hypothetical protein [Thermomonas sp.]
MQRLRHEHGIPAPPAGWAMCTGCNSEHPRTAQAVIVAVGNGGRLLGRRASWPKRRWSWSPAFVAAGGNHRSRPWPARVLEETGVRVRAGSAPYLASQPWPFPGSLMLGFIAEAEADRRYLAMNSNRRAGSAPRRWNCRHRRRLDPGARGRQRIDAGAADLDRAHVIPRVAAMPDATGASKIDSAMAATLLAVIVALAVGHTAPGYRHGVRQHSWFGAAGLLAQRAIPRRRFLARPPRHRAGAGGAAAGGRPTVRSRCTASSTMGFVGVLFAMVVLFHCWGPRDLGLDVAGVLDAPDATKSRQPAAGRLYKAPTPRALAHVDESVAGRGRV